MIPVSLCVCLHLGVSSSRAFSLPQSSPLYPERLDSFAPSPLAARASAIRSRTCGRQRLAFLAVSATGGARKPNPSEGAEAATAAHHRFTFVRSSTLHTPSSKLQAPNYSAFRFPHSALFCPHFPPFPRVLLKKFRFNVNFLPRYAKNYCKKGKNHLLFRV